MSRKQCTVGDADGVGLGGQQRSGKRPGLGPVGGVSCGLFAYCQVAYDMWPEGGTVLFVFCEVTLTFVGPKG